jgi:glyoxylase I family protein
LRQRPNHALEPTAPFTAERRSADLGRVAAHGDTLLYLGCEDIDAAYVHLSSQGVKVEPPTITPYGMKQLSTTDPDGYGLCLQWQVEERQSVAQR